MPKNTSRKPLQRRALLRNLVAGSVGAAVLGSGKANAAPEPPTLVKHIGLCVSDTERAIKFYTEAFGFTVDTKPVKIGAALEPLMEAQGLDMTIQYIETNGGPRLEVFQYANPKVTGSVSEYVIFSKIPHHWNRLPTEQISHLCLGNFPSAQVIADVSQTAEGQREEHTNCF